MAIVAGLTLLGVWVWVSSRSGDAPRAAPAADQDAELQALRDAVEAERERNRELAAQVEWLRLQIEELARGEAPPSGEGDREQAEAEPETEAEPRKPDEELWFDAGSLLASGVPSQEVERLQEIFDASEMEVIELRHRATREGWLRSPRYMKEMQELRTGLREEIGDESFDWLLYATGRNNRVLISDVLGASPAERAGFLPGDVVLSYDGKRIFKTTGLQRATTQGRLGDSVVVEVLRGGEVVRLYPARGPLGVRLRWKRERPHPQ